MASVTIVFRKDKLNKKGEAPIHFRIIKNRKPSYISSGVMLSEKYWDKDRKKVKSSFRNSARLNSLLANKFTEIQDTVFEYETINKSLSSKNLRDKTFGKRPISFFQFSDIVVGKYKLERKIGTYYKNRSIISKLKEYSNADLSFHDITPTLLIKL